MSCCRDIVRARIEQRTKTGVPIYSIMSTRIEIGGGFYGKPIRASSDSKQDGLAADFDVHPRRPRHSLQRGRRAVHVLRMGRRYRRKGWLVSQSIRLHAIFLARASGFFLVLKVWLFL